jgi:hypothetical protein
VQGEKGPVVFFIHYRGYRRRVRLLHHRTAQQSPEQRDTQAEHEQDIGAPEQGVEGMKTDVEAVRNLQRRLDRREVGGAAGVYTHRHGRQVAPGLRIVHR